MILQYLTYLIRPNLFGFDGIFFGHEEDVDEVEDAESAGDKKDDEPPLVGEARGLPKSDTFDWYRGYRDGDQPRVLRQNLVEHKNCD